MMWMLFAVVDDIAKSITAKKRKLEQVTASSLSSGNRKFDEVWKAQQSHRSRDNVNSFFILVCPNLPSLDNIMKPQLLLIFV